MARESSHDATSGVSETQPILARRHADLACEKLTERRSILVAALLDDALERQVRAFQELARAGDALRLQIAQRRHPEAGFESACQRALADSQCAAHVGDREPFPGMLPQIARRTLDFRAGMLGCRA